MKISLNIDYQFSISILTNKQIWIQYIKSVGELNMTNKCFAYPWGGCIWEGGGGGPPIKNYNFNIFFTK